MINIDFSGSDKNDSVNSSAKDIQKYLNTNDAVVIKTKWTPLIGGGRSYKSHKVIKVNENKLVFKTTARVALFYIFLSANGLFVLLLTFFGSGRGNLVVGVFLGIGLIALGVFLLMRSRKIMTFDRRLKAFYKGKVDAENLLNPNLLEGYISLKKLHAVQIIKEHIEGNISHEDGLSMDDKRNNFFSYEINLIMDDGKRVNVVDHGNIKSIYIQATAIANLFDVPVWDACNVDEDQNSSLLKNGTFSFISRGVMFVGWIKGAFAIGMSSLFLWGMYESYVLQKKEESTYQSLSQEEKVEKSKDYTAELFKLVKTKPDPYYIRQAVQRGADVNAQDKQGQTPTHYAALLQSNSTIWTLIKIYADVRIKNNEGKTPRDLLPPVKNVHDFHLHHLLEDAELKSKARDEGKTVLRIERSYNKKGDKVTAVNVIYE